MYKAITLFAIFLFPLYSFGQNESFDKTQLDSIVQSYSQNIKKRNEHFKPPQFGSNVNEYLARRIQYPNSAQQHDIQGIVKISFLLSAEGKVKNAKVEKGIGFGCDEEALRVINSMPKWKPATQDGVPIEIHYFLSVNFAL